MAKALEEPAVALKLLVPAAENAVRTVFLRQLPNKWPVVTGKLPCGLSYTFDNPASVPTQDVRCKCGRRNHLAVKWEIVT